MSLTVHKLTWYHNPEYTSFYSNFKKIYQNNLFHTSRLEVLCSKWFNINETAGCNKVFTCKKETEIRGTENTYVKLETNANVEAVRPPGLIGGYRRTEG